MSNADAISLEALRRDTARALSAAGIEDGDLEARIMIEEVSGLTRAQIIIEGSRPASRNIVSKITALLSRRLKHEPLDHILGVRAFYGRDYAISKDVLSPRADTETLVVEALRKMEGMTKPNLLDLGTGSGAIIISLLAECEDATGTGTDISSKALETAQKNAKKHGVEARLKILQSNWFEAVKGQFDMIVSNPPYIAHDVLAKLSPEVRLYDPSLALDGGADGLDAYRFILSGAIAHLYHEGFLLLEVGFDQAQAVQSLAQTAGYENIDVKRDLSGQDRLLIMQSVQKDKQR